MIVEESFANKDTFYALHEYLSQCYSKKPANSSKLAIGNIKDDCMEWSFEVKKRGLFGLKYGGIMTFQYTSLIASKDNFGYRVYSNPRNSSVDDVLSVMVLTQLNLSVFKNSFKTDIEGLIDDIENDE